MKNKLRKISAFVVCALLFSLCACAGQARENLSVEIKNVDKNPVLYRGTTIYRPDERAVEYTPDDVEAYVNSASQLMSYIKKKYEITYYAYADGEYQGSYQGILADGVYEGEWCVASSEDIDIRSGVSLSVNIKNPYPREVKDAPLDSQIIKYATREIERRFGISLEAVDALAVDLDNCGQDEYILYACNQEQYAHYVCLLDRDGKIIAYLVAITTDDDELEWINRFYTTDDSEPNFLYDLKTDMEIIDCDGDGIYEIFYDHVYYEGWDFTVCKYNRGLFSHQYMTRMTLVP